MIPPGLLTRRALRASPPIPQPDRAYVRAFDRSLAHAPRIAGGQMAAARQPVRLVPARAPEPHAQRRGRRSVELLWGHGHTMAATTIVQSQAASPTASEAASQAPSPADARAAASQLLPDMNRLVDEVVSRLGRQARTERLRRGR
jgi:hypothetical protein